MYNNVRKILKEKGPFDVIHCNDEFENALILKAAAECGVPIRISHTHIVSRKSNVLADMIEKNRKKTIENCATVKIGCSVEACKSFFMLILQMHLLLIMHTMTGDLISKDM